MSQWEISLNLMGVGYMTNAFSSNRDAQKGDEIAAFLADVPLFSTLPMRHLKKFAMRFHEATYEANEVIVEQDKPGIGLHIVVSGSARVMRKHDDGSETQIDTLLPKHFFGELSLLDNEDRSASVIAQEKTVCLGLRKYDFLDELREEPEIAIEMLRELARRFRRLVQNI
jgi:CRP/FNR family cyclic AMP-dependent transcriptional regulator